MTLLITIATLISRVTPMFANLSSTRIFHPKK